MTPPFSVYCCECNDLIGTTDCEITATSPCHCESCHNNYLDPHPEPHNMDEDGVGCKPQDTDR